MSGMPLSPGEPYRNKKILNAARDEQCCINSPACNYNTETVVACHSNYQEDGKGMGRKADEEGNRIESGKRVMGTGMGKRVERSEKCMGAGMGKGVEREWKEG